MEVEKDEVLEPMSPSAQYLKSSALSISIIVVLESELEIFVDDSTVMTLLKDVFLPINPRFSSIMTKKKGVRKWKKVEVNLKEHVFYPTFPSDMRVEYYDECFTEYLSKIASEQHPENRPLWAIHILKYPTKNAAGNVIFKLHHSLGDGYSLMGALLSCLQRVDNPLIPLTFPSRQSNRIKSNSRSNAIFRRVPRFFTGLAHTVYDFVWGMTKSNLVEDDKSPIRSGVEGVEFKVNVTSTIAFSIDQLKKIKSKLDVTINDVITGILNLGIRLYMHKTSEGSGLSKSTALVVFSTRALEGYKSVDEMVKPNSKMPWGNRFATLHIPMPKFTESELQNPLIFIKKAHQTIKRHKNSATIFLTGQLLNFIRKIGGHEATARYIHATLKNSSMTISNVIGPVEQMALANQPIQGLYFISVGLPNSLRVTMISYMGKLRVAMTMEKGFMVANELKSCIEYAFEVIYNAALEVESPASTMKTYN